MTTWRALSPSRYFVIHDLPESLQAFLGIIFSGHPNPHFLRLDKDVQILLNSLSILKIQRLEIPNLYCGQMQSAALSQRVEVFSPVKKLQQALYLVLYAEIPLLTYKCWISLYFLKFLAYLYLQVLNVNSRGLKFWIDYRMSPDFRIRTVEVHDLLGRSIGLPHDFFLFDDDLWKSSSSQSWQLHS